MATFNENTVEQAALGWLHELGYAVVHSETIAPGESAAERRSFNDVLLVGHLRASLDRINAHIPSAVRAGAI